MMKAIIFDWHGVLDETKFESLVYKLAELTNSQPETVLELIKTEAKEYTRGGEPAKFWAFIKQALALDDEKLEEAKNHILQITPNRSLWDKLPALKNAYTLAVLSDCPTDKTDAIRQSINLDCFSTVHFSCEKSLTKSDNGFFLNILTELDLQPAECLYVDDTPKHIETAKRLGFKTCLFSTTADLDEALVA